MNRRPAVYKTAALPAELLRRYSHGTPVAVVRFWNGRSSRAKGCRSARGGVAPRRPDRDSGRASTSRRRARRPGGRRRSRRLRSRSRRRRAPPPTPRESSPPDRRRSGALLRERSTRSVRGVAPPRAKNSEWPQKRAALASLVPLPLTQYLARALVRVDLPLDPLQRVVDRLRVAAELLGHLFVGRALEVQP